MPFRTFIFLALLFAVASAFPAEPPPPAIHLTGNAKIDFFSTPQHLPGEVTLFADAMQEDVPPSAGGEKSPWLAGALSLAVPGAGELYSESYVKAAVFAAVEVTSWIVAYSYNRKGNNQTDDFHAYANTHWNATKYVNWSLAHLHDLNPQPRLNEDQYSYQIYGEPYDPNDPPSCNPPFACINWGEMNAMEDDIRQAPENGYTHLLPSWGDQQYYELIGKYAQFRTGWDDDDLAAGEPPRDLPSSGHHMITYRDMRAKANDYYDVASTFVSVAVINHIASALDAFWSVTRYNKALHAEVRMRAQPTQFGVVPLTEAKFSYTF